MSTAEQLAEVILRSFSGPYYTAVNDTQRARIVSEAARAIAPTPQPAHELAGYFLITSQRKDGANITQSTEVTRVTPAQYFYENQCVILFAVGITEAEYERWGGAK